MSLFCQVYVPKRMSQTCFLNLVERKIMKIVRLGNRVLNEEANR
jgi:hypothetical protein